MKNHQLLFTFGGCSLLLSFVAFASGLFMLAMWTDSHMSELGPYGAIVTPLSMLIGLVGCVLLVAGFFAKKKADQQTLVDEE